MDASEIARLCASMTLTEREGPIRTLKVDLKDAGLRMLATSLVGKVLLSKPVNRDDFRAVMRKIWLTNDEVEIEPIKDNIFAFHFQNTDDKRKIISEGPWSFKDGLIVLEEGKGYIQWMKFNKTEFWIQIYSAPMICMMKDIRGLLGSIISEVLDVDGRDLGSYMVKILRVRVILEIDKPLRRKLRRSSSLGPGCEPIYQLGNMETGDEKGIQNRGMTWEYCHRGRVETRDNRIRLGKTKTMIRDHSTEMKGDLENPAIKDLVELEDLNFKNERKRREAGLGSHNTIICDNMDLA
ncbi:hypothetical protein EZV62_018342 [Acer yangbiense]|uniref:DUF4283 domain-containing protein n=1 Tax=Acer yangbiense TaxID=1000413 RepID=A0A5C7HJR7_9ROSI|nr:hypothetical protein EZV62_018342 [Acer yangbiense]